MNEDDIDVSHEPALKEDGTVYRPNILDDTGELFAFSALLCRHCHVFYADPEAVGGKLDEKLPVKLGPLDEVVCPTRAMAALHKVLSPVGDKLREAREKGRRSGGTLTLGSREDPRRDLSAIKKRLEKKT